MEERLVAARIPFMQIKSLGSEQQKGLQGNVVNVENDPEICASAIPRDFHQCATIQIKLLRRLSDPKPYMYEIVRSSKVTQAAKYLISTPLYQLNNIPFSDAWKEKGDFKTSFCVQFSKLITCCFFIHSWESYVYL